MPLFEKEKSRIKRSVDLSPDTDVALDAFRALAEKRGVSLSRGAAIDAVLGAILRLKPEQAARLYNEARKGIEAAQIELDATSRDDALSWRSAAEDVDGWKSIAELFDVIADDYVEPAPMRSIKMLGQRILIPDSTDWIVVNESNAAGSTKATIVEVKNGSRFGAPHFIYFADGETSTEAIDAAILAVYPRYEDILAARVEPAVDSSGNCLNLEQLRNAPVPGYFAAMSNGSVAENPYGVILIPDAERSSTE